MPKYWSNEWCTSMVILVSDLIVVKLEINHNAWEKFVLCYKFYSHLDMWPGSSEQSVLPILLFSFMLANICHSKIWLHSTPILHSNTPLQHSTHNLVYIFILPLRVHTSNVQLLNVGETGINWPKIYIFRYHGSLSHSLLEVLYLIKLHPFYSCFGQEKHIKHP